MYNLATSPYQDSDEITYYSIGMDSARELIKPLINSIYDYDPVFKQAYEDLSNKVTHVVNKDMLVIQQFTDSVITIKDKISDIKKDSGNIKNKLANNQDDLILSIRSTENQLVQLHNEKIALLARKEILAEELKQQQKAIAKYKELSIWGNMLIPFLSVLLEKVRAFDSLLDEAKTRLNYTQNQINSLTARQDYNEQILKKSMVAFDYHQQITTACDIIQNNINNIQTSLKRLETLRLLKFKLIALNKDWSVLMNIVNAFTIDA